MNANKVWFWNWMGGDGGWNSVSVKDAPTKTMALGHATKLGAGVKVTLVPDPSTLRLVTYDWLQSYERSMASACD